MSRNQGKTFGALTIIIVSAFMLMMSGVRPVQSQGQVSNPGTISAVNAGSGILGGGTRGPVSVAVDPAYVQRRISTDCGAGNAIRSVDSAGVPNCIPAGGSLTGFGTDDTIPKWTSSNDLGVSNISDDGSLIGLSVPVAAFYGITVYNNDADFSVVKTKVGQVVGTTQTSSTTPTINDFVLGSTTTVVFFTGSSPTLTGMTGGTDGRIVKICHVLGSTSILAIGSENAGSTNINRFFIDNGNASRLQNGSCTDVVYVGSAARWYVTDDYLQSSLNVTGTSTLSGVVSMPGGFTSGSTSTIATANTFASLGYAVNSGTATPLQSQIIVWNNGTSGGSFSPTVLGSDNVNLLFDADYQSSTYTARHSSVAGVVKKSNRLNFVKVSGTSAGTNITTSWNSAVATPMAYFDLLTSVFTAYSVYSQNDLTVDGQLLANGAVSLGDAPADNINVNGHGTNAAFLIGRRIFTSNTTYTPTTGTYKVLIEVVGGGGGGGGSTNVSGNASCSAGGASGAYIRKWIDPGAAITGGGITIGTAGAGGALSTSGSGGTVSSISIQGNTYSAYGGSGGTTGPQTTHGIVIGGSVDVVNTTPVGTGTTNVDIIAGTHGEMGVVQSATVCTSGQGGSNPLGVGGTGKAAAGVGANGTGYGAGGGGAVTYTGSGSTGGNGTAGVVIVWEYR